MQNFIQFQAWAETNVNFLYRVRAPLTQDTAEMITRGQVLTFYVFIERQAVVKSISIIIHTYTFNVLRRCTKLLISNYIHAANLLIEQLALQMNSLVFAFDTNKVI